MLSCYSMTAEMEDVVGDKWIKGAVKNKGALRKALGTPEGEPISAEKLKTIKTKISIEKNIYESICRDLLGLIFEIFKLFKKNDNLLFLS